MVVRKTSSMKTNLPLSKSWAIRMLFLDMLYGSKTKYRVIRHFQKSGKKDLADDIRAARRCAESFISDQNIYDVGDSGTVCRFLTYFLDGQKYKIRKGKQLARRKIDAPKKISKLPFSKLLSLGTSQFASAALLKGAKPIKNLPLKCELSVQARKLYFKGKGEWIPKNDEIIIRQINHFLEGGNFKPLISEDYCYARAFGFITRDQGECRWPEMKNHECDRLEAMEKARENLSEKVDVFGDHRVAMAVVLRQKFLGLPIRISDKKCVSKSWPQFWQWLKENS